MRKHLSKQNVGFVYLGGGGIETSHGKWPTQQNKVFVEYRGV